MAHDQKPRDPEAIPLQAFCLGAVNLPILPKRYLALVALIVLLGLGLASRFGRRAWRFLARRLAGPVLVSTEPIQADGTYHNLVFLHHSTGEALIRDGNVRALLARKGYQFWDHGYNRDGLTRPDGTRTHTHYDIPEAPPGGGASAFGNTDPEGLAVLFSQVVHHPPDNAFSRLLQHPVVIFKSCFPNNALRSDEMLERQKAIYLGIRQVLDQHPKHMFLLLTTPPLHPAATDAGAAERARLLSQWLQSGWFLGGHPNLFVFDFFDQLADPRTHMLRQEYQLKGSKGDSHPNALANAALGPRFADFIDQAIHTYVANQNKAEPQPSGK